ncbi:hypothetical protein GF327_03740 [Candidatus Woesearchaeota archaeon]|nr:hypothetical protein [Candidatus Woesearchaeota archaeon]
MKLAFATGPYAQSEDSLYIFLKEALSRNHKVYLFILDDIYTKDNHIFADLMLLSKKRFGIDNNQRYKFDKKVPMQLGSMNAVFLKRDPPVPADKLEMIKDLGKKVFVVNDPAGIIKYKSKSSLERFSEFMPETFFSKDVSFLKQKINELKDCVLKQDFSYGGLGIHRIYEKNNQYFHNHLKIKNQKIQLTPFLKKLTLDGTKKLTLVRFLKNIDQGDKRIIILDGKILGAILRKPSKDSWICNITSGGVAGKTTITEDEQEMIKKISPVLTQDGIHIAGFDTLVDDSGKRVLSEINTTNVGAFHILNKTYNLKLEKKIIDWLEHESF